MKAIVSVDANWAIGYKGKLLQRIPEDMKQFRIKTTGKVVVMGRETYESLPGKAPLKDRVNMVLSANEAFHDDRVILCRSLDELFREIQNYDDDDVFVIGGASVYRQLLPFCSEAYVTKIRNAYTADQYFPDLDHDPQWSIASESELQNYHDIEYSYVKYINRNRLKRAEEKELLIHD